MNIVENFDLFAPRLISKKELLSSGHRACSGCAEVLAVRLMCKALGENTVIASATGCMEIVSSMFPTTAWEVPWIHVAFENAAAVASGVEAGLKALRRKGKIDDRYVKVVGMAGDGGTMDIGFQALSGAMERGHDMIYVCFDNEAYMNTGIQRSSGTPMGASTTTAPAGKVSMGQKTWKKNMPEIMVAHNIPYVATACPSYPLDFIRKIEKAKSIKGPSYIHCFSVCPTGWRTPSHTAISMGRLAVETGVFPLFEVENGHYRLSPDMPTKLKPIRSYFKPQGRFRHLTEDEIDTIQDKVTTEFQKLAEKAKFLKTGNEQEKPTNRGEKSMKKAGNYAATTKAIVKKHGGEKSALIAVLQDIQDAFNYLPKDALKAAAKAMNVPLSRVYEVATFYTAFSLKPRGEHVVKICMGTACHVRGASAIQDKMERTLGIKPGETTTDGKFSLETVNCVGACALGPVVVINTEYHGQVTMAKVDKIIGKINEEGAQS